MDNVLTKVVQCRREFKDYTADEIRKVIENLVAIEAEKIEEELELHEQLNKIEESRLAHISVLESQGVPIPPDLRKQLGIKDLKPRRRTKRTKTKKEKQKEDLGNMLKE